jgi:putative MATE family efflux protein
MFVKDAAFYKKLLLLALPIALQNVITFSVGLADSVMVGALGETPLSGVYMANQLQNILQMLVIGFGAAATVLAAQYYGRGDKKSVKTVIAVSMRLACGAGLVLNIAAALFPQQIISVFTDEPAVAAEAASYLKVICYSYIIFCASNILNISMRCVENTFLGMASAASAFFVNIFLNWVFIFGKLDFPAMGAAGAALATLMARCVEFTVSAVYVFFIDKKLKLRLKDFALRNAALFRDYLKYGLPVLAGDLLWGVNLAVQGIIVGHLGAEVIASVSIANTVFQIISVVAYAAAAASGVIIGKTVGAGEYSLLKPYTVTLQFIFSGLGIITGIALFLIKGRVLLFYNISGETVKTAAGLMTVLSVTVVGTAYQMAALTGIVRAGGSTHFVLFNDLIFVWLIVIPSAAIAAFWLNAPAWAVFACLKCDQILKCGVAAFVVNRYKWVKNLTKVSL